jgi:hypothetical protein
MSLLGLTVALPMITHKPLPFNRRFCRRFLPMFIRIAFVWALFLLLLNGCSKYVPVSGTVQLSDGVPLTGGNVIFIAADKQGKGTIDANGKYSMSFDKPGSGLPPGEYTVLVTGAFFTPKKVKIEDEMDTGSRPMLDVKFCEAETSPLRCTVPNADGYNFTVEPSKEYLAEKRK